MSASEARTGLFLGGIRVFGQMEGIAYVQADNSLGPNEMHIDRSFKRIGPKKPCGRVYDGSLLYVYRGDARRLAPKRYPQWCPLRGA